MRTLAVAVLLTPSQKADPPADYLYDIGLYNDSRDCRSEATASKLGSATPIVDDGG
jgi:hypothetical protein